MPPFFVGLFLGVVIGLIAFAAFRDSPAAMVRQGWFEVGGKAYRVVPAEVVPAPEAGR